MGTGGARKQTQIAGFLKPPGVVRVEPCAPDGTRAARYTGIQVSDWLNKLPFFFLLWVRGWVGCLTSVGKVCGGLLDSVRFRVVCVRLWMWTWRGTGAVLGRTSRKSPGVPLCTLMPYPGNYIVHPCLHKQPQDAHYVVVTHQTTERLHNLTITQGSF